MQLSSVRLWLLQLRGQGIHRSLECRYAEQKLLYRGVKFKVDPKVVALRDKLLYCDYLDHELLHVKYALHKEKIKKKLEKEIKYNKLAFEPAISVLINDTGRKEKETLSEEDSISSEGNEQKPVYMPYARIDSYESTDELPDNVKHSSALNEEYKELYEKYLKANKESGEKKSFEKYIEGDSEYTLPKGELWKVPSTWMTDFEQYDDTLLDEGGHKCYGTPDPNAKVSSIPCGGCGALLHCRDPAIPGYLPSELFLNKNNEDLMLMMCQRCHFLNFYNAALEVKVSADDYPKLLSVIKTKKCAVILMVDVTDFPCSIWPDLKGILHPFTPIFLVGNKIDLLPRDCQTFFNDIKNQLLETVLNVTGINRQCITHVALTSAKTGYGIENLINKLHFKWAHKGDVYLVGCTNVGKSSMFNALLNSDYCKVPAIDLVQRATISAWPGTTLNLLKFPILNLKGDKLKKRIERLQTNEMHRQADRDLQNYKFHASGNIKYATLEGCIGRTFTDRSETNTQSDPFSEKSHVFMMRRVGFDESQSKFKESLWCYDTPGTIHPDQILDLLTTDELLATLPKKIISPRTFIFRPNETVFVAGMGRLDYVEGEYYIRCTLFASEELPITMCHTDHAEEVYKQLLDTEAFVVPINEPERLEMWPELESEELKVTGIDRTVSAADVVLSSIGWIAVTPHENESVTLRAWTPQGRGIYLRTPALLKKSVALRGTKIRNTPMYTFGRQAYVK